MDWRIEFYKNERGKEPVVDFLDSLSSAAQARTTRLLTLLSAEGVLLKEPYTRQIEGKIRELRSSDKSGGIRILYFAWTGKVFVLLHGFIKKTGKTPRKEIELARQRMKDYIKRLGGE